MVYLAFHDVITYEKFSFEHIPANISGLTIFFIADIHRRKIKQKTLRKISQQIDFVVICGDLVERGVSLKRMQDNIVKLKKWSTPVYFVWGNNDYEVDVEKMTKVLKQEEVIILKNTIDKFEKNNSNINIIGLDYDENLEKVPQLNWEQLRKSFTLLLTHHPASFIEMDEHLKRKVDLVLAGHTHGGQIRFFKLGLYQNGGIYKSGNTTMFITEGYGYTLLPLRFQTNAQCHVITIEKNK